MVNQISELLKGLLLIPTQKMGLADAHEIGNSIFRTKIHSISKHDHMCESLVDPLVGTGMSVKQKYQSATVGSTS